MSLWLDKLEMEQEMASERMGEFNNANLQDSGCDVSGINSSSAFLNLVIEEDVLDFEDYKYDFDNDFSETKKGSEEELVDVLRPEDGEKCIDNEQEVKEKGEKVQSDGPLQTVGLNNLWVSGISSHTKAKDLLVEFSKLGSVLGAKILANSKPSGVQCFAMVTMGSSTEALACINEQKSIRILGRNVKIELAQSNLTISAASGTTTNQGNQEGIVKLNEESRSDKQKSQTSSNEKIRRKGSPGNKLNLKAQKSDNQPHQNNEHSSTQKRTSKRSPRSRSLRRPRRGSPTGQRSSSPKRERSPLRRPLERKRSHQPSPTRRKSPAIRSNSTTDQRSSKQVSPKRERSPLRRPGERKRSHQSSPTRRKSPPRRSSSTTGQRSTKQVSPKRERSPLRRPMERKRSHQSSPRRKSPARRSSPVRSRRSPQRSRSPLRHKSPHQVLDPVKRTSRQISPSAPLSIFQRLSPKLDILPLGHGSSSRQISPGTLSSVRRSPRKERSPQQRAYSNYTDSHRHSPRRPESPQRRSPKYETSREYFTRNAGNASSRSPPRQKSSPQRSPKMYSNHHQSCDYPGQELSRGLGSQSRLFIQQGMPTSIDEKSVFSHLDRRNEFSFNYGDLTSLKSRPQSPKRLDPANYAHNRYSSEIYPVRKTWKSVEKDVFFDNDHKIKKDQSDSNEKYSLVQKIFELTKKNSEQERMRLQAELSSKRKEESEKERLASIRAKHDLCQNGDQFEMRDYKTKLVTSVNMSSKTYFLSQTNETYNLSSTKTEGLSKSESRSKDVNSSSSDESAARFARIRDPWALSKPSISENPRLDYPKINDVFKSQVLGLDQHHHHHPGMKIQNLFSDGRLPSTQAGRQPSSSSDNIRPINPFFNPSSMF